MQKLPSGTRETEFIREMYCNVNRRAGSSDSLEISPNRKVAENRKAWRHPPGNDFLTATHTA
jgi:hypothetical protein